MKDKNTCMASGVALALAVALAGCNQTMPVSPEAPAAAPAAAPKAASPAAAVQAPAPAPAAATVAAPAPTMAAVAAEPAAGEPAKRFGGPPNVTGLTQRWEALGNLLERSSAAKHIEHEGSAESKQLQKEARAKRTQAKEAIDAGALDKADALLREASQLMFKAERSSRSPAVAAEKAKTDYAARLGSVQALLQTGRRIAGEEHASRPEFAKADALLKAAEKLAGEGKHAEGKVQLDQAYVLISEGVRGMREGKEIRAEKKFANKGEEYQYEQSRNDDYKSLIANIAFERDDAWNNAAKEADQLRDEADAVAKRGDHAAALQKIFQSTNKLKGLLRRAGFPII